MKKTLIFLGALGMGYVTYAQQGNVGINTESPKATLEITPNTANAAATATTNEGILAPRLNKARIANIATPVEGTLVYATNTIYTAGADATKNNRVAKITEKGYYYYNGTEWVKAGGSTGATLPAGTANNQVLKWNGTTWAPAVDTNDNIYTTDGTLSGNRTVTQGTNNLMFTGEGKVGFGTATPRAKVDIVGGVRVSKGDATGDTSNVGYAFEGDGDTGMFAIGGAASTGSDLVLKNNSVSALTVKNATRNVGIHTDNPAERLEVAGNIRAIGGVKSLGSTNIGGWLELENTLKTGTEAGRWRIYNMTHKENGGTGSIYANGLHFWGYAADGTNLGSKMVITDEGNVGIGFGGSPNVNYKEKLEVDGSIRSTALAGTGNRNVVADADGKLIIGDALTATTTPGAYTVPASSIVVVGSGKTEYTVSKDSQDYYISVNGATADQVIINLPTPAEVKGRIFVITNKTAGNVVIRSGGVQALSGTEMPSINKKGTGMTLISDGINWFNLINF